MALPVTAPTPSEVRIMAQANDMGGEAGGALWSSQLHSSYE